MAATVGVAALAWIWFLYDGQRQDKYLRTAGVFFAAFVVFLIWVLLGSGWRRRLRWSVFGGTLALIVFCRICLKITGVNGDLVPIVGWRWTQTRSHWVPAVATNRVFASTRLTNSYPQFLGPNRDGILTGPRLDPDWNLSPPTELWRHEVGPAWSGFAIEGGHAITQEQQGERELVVSYDLATGAQRWSHEDASRYATTIAGEGPRATPTISSNRVYTMGGAGMLNCLDLATGKVIWSTNTLAQHGLSKPPMWGVACSPLVTGRAVIVTAGGAGHTLVAYDRDDGRVLWSAGTDEVQWSSPVRAVIGGVPQILIFNLALAAHDEETGKVLWQHPWPGANPRVTMPLAMDGDRVLISTGYGMGSELLQVSHDQERWRAKRIWKSIRLKSKFANLFHIEGFVYGLDDGALACIDVNTGELKWKGERYGHGQMILVGGVILLMAERGELVLIEPKPTEPRELARFKVFAAKTWNPPALAGDLLVVRNDREAACFRLPLARQLSFE
jgi:outer membrane protein assembly factor BamB